MFYIHNVRVAKKIIQEGPRDNSVCRGGGMFQGLFLANLQQMHDCVLSQNTHDKKLKLNKKH